MYNKPKKEEGVSSDCSERLDYLMRRFGNQVLKLAYYHLRDRHEAEDVAQEVFYRVYKNLDHFRQESSYYTWIYRITVNLCNDRVKSAYFRRILPWSSVKGLEQRAADTNRLLEAAEGGEVFQKVMDLPYKYRVVVALYYFEELTTPEIAEVLQINENAVRTRLSRARNMLKDIFQEGGWGNE